MTDLRNAAKLALEALEHDNPLGRSATITVLKRALAEDAMDKMAENARELGLDYEPDIAKVGEVGVWGEPVAWVENDGEIVWQNFEAAVGYNLYTVPPQREWQGLTDEEKRKFLGGDAYSATMHDINAIEAKLKEKNG